MRSILTSLPEGVVVVDKDLRIQVWNRLAEDLWGLRQDEAIGQHLLALDIGLPLEHLQPTPKAVLAGQPGAEVELAAVNRRGKSVRVRVGATPLAEGRAEPTGSVLVMHLLSD